jgi:hypothetical protein
MIAASETFVGFQEMSLSGRTEKYRTDHMFVAKCLSNVRCCSELGLTD